MADLGSRSDFLRLLYQRNREELKPILRAFCLQFEATSKAVENAKTVLDADERGRLYLRSVIDLLAVGEVANMAFTISELHELRERMELARMVTEAA